MTLKKTTFRLDSYNPSIETGFYYLQSRYYDPAVKRFLSADALASTGQGFTGYNMFAYCENNSVNMSDSSGEIPFWTLIRIIVLDWGLAHFLVQSDIKKNHKDVEVEVYVDRGKEKGGRMDVYLKGSVWEVKHVASGELAFSQASSYLYCKLSDRDEYVRKLGAAGAFKGTIKIELAGYTYRIDYSTPNAGVILYSVSEDFPDEQHVNEYAPVVNRQRQENHNNSTALVKTAIYGTVGCAIAYGVGVGFNSYGSSILGGFLPFLEQPA